MLDITPFTDEQWWKLCDARASLPVALSIADLSQPFVYDRTWGVFYVPMGYHQLTMATLWAFHHQKGPRYILEDISLQADSWLEHIPGAAFKSSVGKNIQIATFKNLTIAERRLFSSAKAIF